MSSNEAGDMFYNRAFPMLCVLCTVIGAAVYAYGVPSLAMNTFIAVGFGIRLDSHIQRRRFETAERIASEGWSRLRGPVHAG
ncbi:MAG: hypothetical protein AAF205_02840 [Pseudomonadota bacterium]